MPAKQFFDLDINKLFEEHGVKEIEQIQKTIQQESDRKKIELRTLVGERYRDLIQAADTIAEMRETSKNVISRITDIEATFRDLQRKYLIGFKIEASESSAVRDLQNGCDSVVMQIKILMDIPEHIWSAIDNRDLLLASQLFILAQHVNYSLTFEIGKTTLADKYPIVAKQWSVIGHFKSVVIDECNQALQSLDLPTEVAANCLAALFLLDGTSSKDLLVKLINLRCRAIESILKDESPQSVRHRIRLSVKLLNDTVVLVHSCFIRTTGDRNRGLVADYAKKLRTRQASEILYDLDLDNDLLAQFLPKVTRNHRPFENEDFVEFSSDRDDEIAAILDDWLRWIERTTSTEIARLLSLVTSIRGVYNTRDESLSLETRENWTTIVEETCAGAKNFWSTYYQPLLTRRVKEIIEEKLDESLTYLKSEMIALLARIGSEKCDFPEHDLRWYVWKDSISDVPQKLAKIGDPRRSLNSKSRGYSPSLVELCEKFDERLNALLRDLERYLYENETSGNYLRDNLYSLSSLGTVFDKFHDRAEIQENLQDASTAMFDELVAFVDLRWITAASSTSTSTVDPERRRHETNLVFLARFYQAITCLCPNLNKCFTLSRVSGLIASNVKWQTICDRARDETTRLWTCWANLYKIRAREIREKLLKDPHDEEQRGFVGDLVSEWERVLIEEEAEEGKSIKSEILVPYQASVKLQKFLANVTRDLNRVIPHTLPKKVMNEIIDHVATELFDHYDETAKHSELRQKQAFQVLFDIKYVSLLMVPRENKKLMDRSIQASNSVLAKIDPFDSDVFYPFIHVNVKKSVQRSLLIFGNLVPNMEQLHSVLGSRSDYAASDASKSMTDPPGGLAVCTGAPWFPPLAVTAPTRNLPLMSVSISDKTQRKKTPVKEAPKNDSTGATIKSGAAAFFGAMGSDWFSTG